MPSPFNNPLVEHAKCLNMLTPDQLDIYKALMAWEPLAGDHVGNSWTQVTLTPGDANAHRFSATEVYARICIMHNLDVATASFGADDNANFRTLQADADANGGDWYTLYGGGRGFNLHELWYQCDDAGGSIAIMYI